ncbi:MAG: O-succinylhomoserine sulfhydrylase [Porticoccaceae bacterium]
MNTDDTSEYGPATLAVRAGQRRTAEREHSEALFLTSSYVFENAASAAAHFSNEVEGNVYSRYTNPTVRNFEERLAAMEGAQKAVATSSGMAAILAVVMGHLKQGDQIICSRDVFGSTHVLLEKTIAKFGVQVAYVPLADLAAWRAAIQSNTKLLYCETPSNPLAEVADMQALAEIAHSADALLVVDNCFCTPALQQPLKWGADLIIHSATKFIDGQGRCLGGAVVGSRELLEPVLGFVRSAGPTMSPFNAWVFLKGLETLNIRMRAHCDSAAQLAEWLQQQPAVEKVYYAGLPGHPGHATAAKQQSAFGAVVGFVVRGGQQAAWRVIDHCKLLSLTANLGDSKTTIVHPATTTHGRLSDESRAAAGIVDGLVRISVGLEEVVDIKADLAAALAQLEDQ